MVTLIVAFKKAEPVDIPTAKQVAENYYKHYAPESITDFSIKSVHTKSHNGINTYYTFVFNAGGFVIVSADNAIVPVLGYSHEGEIDGNKLNPIADLWMEQYDKNIVDIVSQKLSNTETLIEWNSILGNSFPKNDRAVNPIFNINWGQGTGFAHIVLQVVLSDVLPIHGNDYASLRISYYRSGLAQIRTSNLWTSNRLLLFNHL